MRRFVVLLGLALVGFAGVAFAQPNGFCASGCGNRCYNAPNPSSCESMCISRCSFSGGQTQRQQTPLPVLPLFAALSFTPDYQTYGWSYHMPSNEAATAAAQQACERQGQGKCKTLPTTHGSCLGILQEIGRDGKPFGMFIKTGNTQTEASRPMIQSCQQRHPEAECRIVLEKCDD